MLLTGLVQAAGPDGPSAAAGLEARRSDPSVSLTPYFAVLEDPGLALTLVDVQRPEVAGRFKADLLPAAALNYGFTRSAYWLRLRLRNDSDHAVERLLEIASPRHASVQFHTPRTVQTQSPSRADSVVYETVDTGYLKPFAERPYKNRFFVFPVTLPAHSDHVVYLRFLSSPSAMEIPARLWTPDAFHAYERADYMSQSWYFGMLMAMAAFNLLLFIALLDVRYLLYVLFASCTALAMAANNGIAVEYLWSNTPRWTPIATMMTFSASLGFMFLFMRRMLSTHELVPRLDRVLRLFLALHLVGLPIGLLIAPPLFVKVALFLAGVTGLLVLIVGLACALKRQRSAYFFLAAFSLLCLGGVLTVLRGFGVVPTNVITTNGMQICSAIELLLLAFALADRFNVLRREKARAQREAIKAQRTLVETLQSSERQLEERVTQRTADLSAANAALGEAYAVAEASRQETEQARQELSTSLDISRGLQQQLGEALGVAESAARAKSQLLANVSHEIRTPMNGILGLLTLLQKTPLDPRQLDYASKTEGAARSLLHLLNDILDFSKAEAGKMSLDPQAFRPDRLLRDLSVILSASLGEKPVALRFDIDPELPASLLGDPLRLQQILINLGSNAIKFTASGEVFIKVRMLERDAKQVLARFSVRDTGIGISAQNQEHIFDGFSQADESITRQFGGTGLGLAISKRLVELMGGRLLLESVPGQGSIFHFCIKLNIVASALVDATDAPDLARSGLQTRRLDRLRILLVEDNALNQQVAKELLEAEGAADEGAGNGQLGVEAVNTSSIAASRFDVVLMDVQMPVLDGYAATRRIRQMTDAALLPIIAMTANAMRADREACRAAGMNDFVVKPIDFQHLISTILLHCRRRGDSDAIELTRLEGLAESVDADSAARSSGSASGIDVGFALLRMCGDRRLYGSVLRGVIGRLSELPAALLTHLKAGDRPGAQRTLHTLKGLTAMIGADELADRLAHYESQFDQGIAAERVEGLVRQLDGELKLGIPPLLKVAEDFPLDAGL